MKEVFPEDQLDQFAGDLYTQTTPETADLSLILYDAAIRDGLEPSEAYEEALKPPALKKIGRIDLEDY